MIRNVTSPCDVFWTCLEVLYSTWVRPFMRNGIHTFGVNDDLAL